MATRDRNTSWRRLVDSLLRVDQAELQPVDLAQLNLACAVGLPGAQGLDIEACLRQLDDWAALIGQGTQRMLPEFQQAPDEFQESEGYFRILVMVTVLQRNIGVEYNQECMAGPPDCTDSRNLFLHGLLETRRGTCLSMPVLYVVIARRLGYPVFLVGAKQHLFARWGSPGGERFNIECTTRGLVCHPDEHYHRWPVPLTQRDLDRGYYLHSMSPAEELACFLAARGHCLRDNLRLAEAVEAFAEAGTLAPRDPNYSGFHAIATVLFLELGGRANYGVSQPGVQGHVLAKGRCRPLQSWETWAVPRARQELQRILSIRRADTDLSSRRTALHRLLGDRHPVGLNHTF